MMLALYRTATILGAPFILFYLNQRKASGKEDPNRFAERLGLIATPRPSGPLLWVHAASVGESLSMLPLIEKLLATRPECHLLMTTGTVTSAKLMQERLPERAFHQYIPVDRPSYVRRFLDHWKPVIALWAESEFWPNMITETASRNIPMVLVNGRISPKSFAGWQRARGLIKTLLDCFNLCLGQTDEDASRLNQLGSSNAQCVGNLKFAVPALPADENELTKLKSSIGDRAIWLAASTHPGEEEMIANTHQTLKTNHPGILTIIVPRHPARGIEIEQSLRKLNLSISVRSKNDAITANTDIYIADTVGELGLFFRLTDIAFMGKSLVPLGGQNPLEALRLDCAVLHGPHMLNFKWMSEQMISQGCSKQVANEAELSDIVAELLSNPQTRQQMIERGRLFVESQAKVVDLVTDEIINILNATNGKTKDNAAA